MKIFFERPSVPFHVERSRRSGLKLKKKKLKNMKPETQFGLFQFFFFKVQRVSNNKAKKGLQLKTFYFAFIATFLNLSKPSCLNSKFRKCPEKEILF